MNRTTLPLTLLASLCASGCLVYADGPGPGGGGTVENFAPEVTWADASCYWDASYQDDVWWFQADIFDENGLDDVTGVYADVYDGETGEWADAFELYYDGGHTWYSAWQGESTYLDCAYYDYVVEFSAEDTAGPGELYSLDLY